MLIKPRTTPVKNLVLSAVLPIISPDHPKWNQLTQEYKRRCWGYVGEQSLEYYLSFLPHDECFILHGLKLENGTGNHFSIDTLIIFQAYTLIVEVKHWTGIIEVQIRGELLKINGESNVVFDDPIQQVKHQTWQLGEWARIRKLTLPPTQHVVVFSYSKLQIDNAHLLSPKAIRSNQLLENVRLWNELHPTSTDRFSLNQLENTALLLKNSHIEEEFFYPSIHKLGLTSEEISSGVFCTACNYAPMSRIKRTWKCTKCGKQDRDAHVKSLAAFILMFGRYATSIELQKFLNINKSSIVWRILRELKVSKSGRTNATVFDLYSSEVLKKEVMK
ncbi:hypothetical protein CR194_14405 [Salipaludibacillus keqinensis]|uniref:NERD domain-containing protein n=1 Tax=Salipaludibacillus keqinensis TaxID=2045207 RepID=A0A323TTR2_9BACI|nr:nuclease-related domain-containing protein [Salipaludibacillus keqinensis]PYZ92835.1 hypothetical protein CR194_14405 [Salipaludibacillus keqinensis]